MTAGMFGPQEQAAEFWPLLRWNKAGDRTILRRRLQRLCWLLKHSLTYASFLAAVHFTRTGRILYRHSYVFDRKFLGPYLSTALNSRQKLAVQMHLVRLLETRFRSDFLPSLQGDGLCLWAQQSEAESHRIILRLADASKFEGDLALEYIYNDTRLHRLSFVFSPGFVFDLRDPDIAFVGGSQGAQGAQEQTRSATKGNGGVHPSNMLVLALRAISEPLGIERLCGVTARCQIFNYTRQTPGPETYDRLWATNGGVPRGHVYDMEAALTSDDDGALTGTHKTRRRRRRRARLQIAIEIAGEIRKHLAPVPGVTPHTRALDASGSDACPISRPERTCSQAA